MERLPLNLQSPCQPRKVKTLLPNPRLLFWEFLDRLGRNTGIFDSPRSKKKSTTPLFCPTFFSSLPWYPEFLDFLKL